MISFKAFVNAIHDAILSANDTLSDQNLEILNKYFDGDENPQPDQQVKQDTAAGQAALSGRLKAKSVVVEYPQHTSEGTKMVGVEVPLITLVPLSLSQVEQVKLSADFQIQIVEDELQLLFPKESPPGKKPLFGKNPQKDGTIGRIEITITPADMSDGLKALVEGYEKALKSQIP